MSELQEATKEFLIESHENLDQLDVDLVGLEKSAAPAEALARIFRALHTIKGSCSFLGFSRLETVAHAGETLLGRLRDNKIALSPSVTDALLRMVDAIRKMLGAIETEGNDGDTDHTSLVGVLNRLSTDQTLAGIRARADLSPSQAAISIPEYRAPVAQANETGSDSESPSPDSSVYDASVRINVELLDKLMTIAGEIVLARNQILQYSQRQTDASFHNTCRQLNLITTELQEHVMKTRLQPLCNVWNRFPRLAHDTAQACGKHVRLEMQGSETELDKTLIEAIRDPLTHLVRNAIDHGIESPERRRAAGKPAEGCVRLRAYHEGGQVNVEISDDGGGIDPQRVKERAVEQRLITGEQAGRMSTETLVGLIFLPGFSTAQQVTTLSGRGVGMDVVKTNIEKIGGVVDVTSTIGQGTTVRIRIPLTLAIIKVLVVTSAGDRFAIPQVSIVELLRVEGEKARRGIQRVHGVWVYRYRDRLLPLVGLNEVLKVGRSYEPAGLAEDDGINIVVLQAADEQFGLVVDHINDTQEIVVKPLWRHLKSVACFAGATIMGEGKVALILDVFGLARRAGAIGEKQSWAAADAPAPAAPPSERLRVLLVEGRDSSRMAIPLNKVSRLEKFPAERVERIADRRVVQYGGQILPLLDVGALLQTKEGASQRDGPVQVVVCARQERPVGLIVERILDVVEQESDVRGAASRQGVECTAVIQNHVTEMLDVEGLMRMAVGEL